MTNTKTLQLAEIFTHKIDIKTIEHLLRQLTICQELENIRFDVLRQILKNNPYHVIYAIRVDNEVIGMITLLIEHKLIHDFGKVCHIEDFVIDKKHRGKGIGKMVMDIIKDLCYEIECYKIVLNCKTEVQDFYRNCGFTQKQVQMSYYIPKDAYVFNTPKLSTEENTEPLPMSPIKSPKITIDRSFS